MGLDNAGYDDFKMLAADCWNKANEADALPTLSTMLSFARKSIGSSAKQIAEQNGVVQRTVHFWESADAVPERQRLPRYAQSLHLSESAAGLLEAAHPAAQAYASAIRPFRELLSTLVEAYGGGAKFLDAVGLSGRFTEAQLDRLLAGAPPGPALGRYLNAFADSVRGNHPDVWLRAASHVRLLNDESPIELSAEAYAAAREGTLRRIASEPTSGEEPPTLARMLRFARDSKGIFRGALADTMGVIENTIKLWESGTVTPQPDRLAPLARALSLPDSAMRMLESVLPAAQAYASTVRPFSERLSALVEAYGGRAQFADAVGLSDRITEEQLDSPVGRRSARREIGVVSQRIYREDDGA